ncbi:Uncharacterised protein (plasmid) [Serratia marcescens]|nr:Uncharacterised protein [Serratia marcescens]CAI2041515.1 Uncharacterised protein [Serratia marcescens]
MGSEKRYVNGMKKKRFNNGVKIGQKFKIGI